MTGTTEHMIYLSLVMTLLCSFANSGSFSIFLEELLPQPAQGHILLKPLRGGLDVIDHILTKGQLSMTLPNLLLLDLKVLQ